jgi:hypothetical protein
MMKLCEHVKMFKFRTKLTTAYAGQAPFAKTCSVVFHHELHVLT